MLRHFRPAYMSGATCAAAAVANAKAPASTKRTRILETSPSSRSSCERAIILCGPALETKIEPYRRRMPPSCARFAGRVQLLHPLAHAAFVAGIARLVIAAADEVLGKAFHVRDLGLQVVGILIAFSVSQPFHQPGGSIAEVVRHRIGAGGADILEHAAVGGVQRIRLGRQCQIGAALGQGKSPFRQPHGGEGLAGGEGLLERARIGEADVLGGEAHHAARDVERVFAGLEHARQPVEAGVHVAVAQRLVQGGDEVEVLFPRTVIEQRLVLGLELSAGEPVAAGRRSLEQVERGAGVAVGEGGNAGKHAGLELQGRLRRPTGKHAALAVGNGPFEQGFDVAVAEGLEHEDAGAGEQGGVDLEAGVLGGGADEGDGPAFDEGKKSILLGAVEAVDFIHEEHGALAGAVGALGGGHDLADFLDAAGDGAEGHEALAGAGGDHPRQRSLAHPWRPPEQGRAERVALDGAAQGLAGREQRLLADDLVQRARAHTVSQGSRGGGLGGRKRRLEERHRVHDSAPGVHATCGFAATLARMRADKLPVYVLVAAFACALPALAQRRGSRGPAQTWPTTEGDYVIPNFQFNDGETLPQLNLHYTTLGAPHKNAQGVVDNAVLIIHGTGGTGHQFLSPIFAGPLYGPGEPLDITKFYLILPDEIGHGKSSKPSDGLHAKFPHYGYHDMVRAEYELLTQHLGVNHLRLVMGTSMGGMQSWMWPEMYPTFMDAAMPLASEPAQIAGRNRYFRRMVMDSISKCPDYDHGEYKAPPVCMPGAFYALAVMTSSPKDMQRQM